MNELTFFDEVIKYHSINSTNAEAKKLILSKQVQGNFLLIADRQSSGVGRSENKWYSPEGGLYCTVGFFNLPLKSSLTIYIAIKIVKALIDIYPQLKDEIKIKWPNDIYLADKKICGILTSAFPAQQYIITGIGLNTNIDNFPPELSNKATSLYLRLNNPVDHDFLLSTTFDFLAQDLPDFLINELSNHLAFYREHSFLHGRRIKLNTEFEVFAGLVKGITTKGALLMELDNGLIQPFYSCSVIEII